MASMIGIGVAVDYSLFVLARYREEIARRPRARRRRARPRWRPPALAVLFSGMTVIASLAGLFLIDTTAIQLDGASARSSSSPSRCSPRRRCCRCSSALHGQARVGARPARSAALRRRERGRGATRRLLGALDRARHAPPGRSRSSPRRALLLALAAPVLNLETDERRAAPVRPADETRAGLRGRGGGRRRRARSTPVRVLVARAAATSTARARARCARDREVARGAPDRSRADDGALRRSSSPSCATTASRAQAKAAVDRLRERRCPAASRSAARTASQTDFEDARSPARCGRSSLFVLGLSLPRPARAAAQRRAAAQGRRA